MSKSYLNNTDPNIPRGISNNNPGNIRFRESNNWAGKVPKFINSDPGKEFEQFESIFFGYVAMLKLLRNYMKNGNNTIEKILNRWAPSHENSTQNYISEVSRMTGYRPGEKLSINKTVLRKLAWAITLFENGNVAKEYVSKKDISRALNSLNVPEKQGNGPSLAYIAGGVGLIAIGVATKRSNNGTEDSKR